ncbi:hypothetical protein SAMN04487904_103395 [Actinopolyspora lacussalsi subsp. righensis]|uniref:Uncharacterized protein n=1 Tax=Actinopolyspora righensis TaxID=995060 RepID=A0A1I6YYH8_9ACTN|nr:hypothetical protein [Actinopolyspora righensis]SFT55560.1 hypothetical protein SAMN04487904_103395 [Actinopolyspora righensis]
MFEKIKTNKTLKEFDQRKEWENRIKETWALPDEEFESVITTSPKHAASIVNGEPHIPHTPLSETPGVELDRPEWPLPSEIISNGCFLEDEWANDPTIGYLAVATSPKHEAVRVVDHLSVGYERSALVITDRRLAVVIESQLLKSPPANKNNLGSNIIGKASRFARQTQETAEKMSEQETEISFSTLHETDISKVTNKQYVLLGKEVPRRSFFVVDFSDGSRLYR